MKKTENISTSSSHCLLVEDLGLVGDLAEKWKSYIFGLNQYGIRLTYGDDVLVWTWNGSDGRVCAKLAYAAISAGYVNVAGK